MKSNSSKRLQRLERKKKKMAAFIEISTLNEKDRVKNSKIITNNTMVLEPSPKRLCNDLDVKLNSQVNLKEEEINTSSGKPLLEGEEFLQLKARLRLQTKKMRAEPVFRLREVGENSRIQVDINDRVPLFMSDIQHLLLYSQLGHFSPYSPTRWCQLEKFPKLQQTSVLIVENVSLYHFQSYQSFFPYLTNCFNDKLEMVTPLSYKGDIVSDLSTIPLTGTQVRKFLNKYITLEAAIIESDEIYDRIKDLFPLQKNYAVINGGLLNCDLPFSDNFPRTELLLSGWQMVEENFPLPIKGLMNTKYAGYRLTKDQYKEVTAFSPMFGLDCEMCLTSTGDSELTRVSIVDESYNVVYEELVKPDNKIVNYLTQYSGITSKMMRNVKKRLKDVQEDLRKLLPSDAILVGQSLGNDLHALKLMHPYVIDSSVVFNLTGDRTRKSKLQLLTQEFLSRRIQEGRRGHCPVEDSKASLELIQLKLKNDITFGDAVLNSLNGMNQIRCPELGHPNFATSFLKQIVKTGKPISVSSLPDLKGKYEYYVNKGKKLDQEQISKIKLFAANTNEEVVMENLERGQESSMNIAHLRLNEADLRDGVIEETFRKIDKWVKDCYEIAFAPSLNFVIFCGNTKTGNGCCFIKLKNSF